MPPPTPSGLPSTGRSRPLPAFPARFGSPEHARPVVPSGVWINQPPNGATALGGAGLVANDAPRSSQTDDRNSGRDPTTPSFREAELVVAVQ